MCLVKLDGLPGGTKICAASWGSSFSDHLPSNKCARSSWRLETSGASCLSHLLHYLTIPNGFAHLVKKTSLLGKVGTNLRIQEQFGHVRTNLHSQEELDLPKFFPGFMKPPALLRDVACTYLKHTFQLAMCDSARQPSHFGGCSSLSIHVHPCPLSISDWAMDICRASEHGAIQQRAGHGDELCHLEGGLRCGQHSGTGPVNFDSLTVNVLLPLKSS